MNTLDTTAKIIIALGFMIMIIGIILYISSKMGLGAFHLPGDIIIKRENFTFYFPWVTCILISAILSILLNVVRRN